MVSQGLRGPVVNSPKHYKSGITSATSKCSTNYS
jgi:hypothetical protein